MNTENTNVVITKAAQIVKMYDEGMSKGDIAKALGIKYQHVYNTLVQKGKHVVDEVRDSTNTKTAKILEAYKETQSVGQSAKAVGVSYQFAYNVLTNKKVISAKK